MTIDPPRYTFQSGDPFRASRAKKYPSRPPVKSTSERRIQAKCTSAAAPAVLSPVDDTLSAEPQYLTCRAAVRASEGEAVDNVFFLEATTIHLTVWPSIS